MWSDVEHIRAFRMHVHHLDRPLPPGAWKEAAFIGFQNTPPGIWEIAAFQRMAGVTRAQLQQALINDRILLQAWSIRGVPLIFSSDDSAIFLTSLIPQADEQPWIYTEGLKTALDQLGLSFSALLAMLCACIDVLDTTTVVRKETLDQLLAAKMEPMLPLKQRALWRSPSPYDQTGKQQLGEAVVSFLLRPCAHLGKVVFGVREKQGPSFLSAHAWLKTLDPFVLNDPSLLVRRFLHAYGPSERSCFQKWLGSSARQAARLWEAGKEAMCAVTVMGKTRYLLREDLALWKQVPVSADRLQLLAAHDPYLELRDRDVILASPILQKKIWRIQGNLGAIVRAGAVIGCWQMHTQAERMQISMELFEDDLAQLRRQLCEEAEKLAAFMGRSLTKVTFVCDERKCEHAAIPDSPRF